MGSLKPMITKLRGEILQLHHSSLLATVCRGYAALPCRLFQREIWQIQGFVPRTVRQGASDFLWVGDHFLLPRRLEIGPSSKMKNPDLSLICKTRGTSNVYNASKVAGLGEEKGRFSQARVVNKKRCQTRGK